MLTEYYGDEARVQQQPVENGCESKESMLDGGKIIGDIQNDKRREVTREGDETGYLDGFP